MKCEVIALNEGVDACGASQSNLESGNQEKSKSKDLLATVSSEILALNEGVDIYERIGENEGEFSCDSSNEAALNEAVDAVIQNNCENVGTTAN